MGIEDIIRKPDTYRLLLEIRIPELSGSRVETLSWDREAQTPIIEIKNMPHVIPTWDLSYKATLEYEEICTNNPDLQRMGVEIKRIPYGRSKDVLAEATLPECEFLETKARWVLWAIGPREMRDYLPKPFITGSKNDQRNNATRMARIREGHYAFDPNDAVRFIGEFLREKMYGFDNEVRGRPVYDDIFLTPRVIIKRGQPLCARMFLTDPYPYAGILAPTPVGLVECTLDLVGRQEDIGNGLTREVHKEHPLFCLGQNHGTYDARILNTLTGTFEPGIGTKKKKDAFVEKTSRPRNRGGGFFKRYEISGLIMVDYAPFHQKFASLPNNKLETIARYWNIPFTKSTHGKNNGLSLEIEEDDYARLETWAQAGLRLRDIMQAINAGEDTPALHADYEKNMRLFENALFYAVPDAIMHLMIGLKETKTEGRRESLLEDILWGSFLLQCDPSKLCVTSKKKQGLEFWERKYFERLHTFSDRQMPSKDRWEDFTFNEEKLKGLTLPTKKGTYNATIIYPTPFFFGLGNIIRNEPFAKRFYDHMQRASPKHKDILAQMLEIMLMKPVYDLATISEKPETDWFFGKIYGIKECQWPEVGNIPTCRKNIGEAKSRLQDFLATHEVINYSPKYILLQGDVDISALERDGIAIKRGVGRCISQEPGEFAIAIDNNPQEVISCGLDIYARKGNKTLLEQKIIKGLYESFFQNNNALSLIEQAMDLLKHPSTELKRNLLFTKTATRDFNKFRATSHSQRRIQVQIREGIRKGEKFSYGYGIRAGVEREYLEKSFLDPVTRIDLEWYLDKFFGPREEKGRRFAEGSIGKIILSLSSDVEGKLHPAVCHDLNRLVDGEDYMTKYTRANHGTSDDCGQTALEL